MNCPVCKKEMIPGVVKGKSYFFFTTDTSKDYILAPAAKDDDVMLCSHYWTRPTAVAHHCPNCKKVVVDYSVKAD